MAAGDVPTGTDEITLLDDAGIEVAVVGIPRRGSDVSAVVQHLKQWLQGESSRLVHLEVDRRRQRRAAETEGEEPGADPRNWTADQWAAFSASQEERLRARRDELEPRLRERSGLSPERTRAYVERLIREVGEEPDPGVEVVQWWQLSLDERYQRYELVERGVYELGTAHTAHPEFGDTSTEGTSKPAPH
jgi:hypothetical protein